MEVIAHVVDVLGSGCEELELGVDVFREDAGQGCSSLGVALTNQILHQRCHCPDPLHTSLGMMIKIFYSLIITCLHFILILFLYLVVNRN